MSKRLKYSAISYVAAILLALSGQSAAAPADVSGVKVTASNYAKELSESQRFLAMNHRTSVIPSVVIVSERQSAGTIQHFDAKAIDNFQERMNAELESVIELKGF